MQPPFSLDAPSFHILDASPPFDNLSSDSSHPPPHLPSSPPRVVLVLGKWEPDVAYCAEVSDGGRGRGRVCGCLREGGWLVCIRWGQSARMRISWQAFVVSPADQKTGRVSWQIWLVGRGSRRTSSAPVQGGGSWRVWFSNLFPKTASWPGCSWTEGHPGQKHVGQNDTAWIAWQCKQFTSIISVLC